MRRLVRVFDKRLTSDEAEQISRITLVFNLVALLFLGFFSIVSYLSNEQANAMVLIEVMAVSVGAILLFLVSGRMNVLVLTTCIGYLPFCAYLQINGGQNGSGILWHYVYPIMVYYIAGLRWGSIFAGILILMEIAITLLDNHLHFPAQYSYEFKLRFHSTMLVMSIMGAMLEHSRSTAQKNLMLLANTLEKISQTDELTGIANRRALQERLRNEIVRAERNQTDFTVILCDIDKFKNINDLYGHSTGDKALRHIAAILSERIRKYDLLARWGGEEFLLVLPETNAKTGMVTAERIRKSIEDTPLLADDGELISITISCGVCTWREKPDIDQIFCQADLRLYRAKHEGRNRVIGPSHHPPES